MKIENVNIQYHPVIEKKPIGIEPDIIEKLFTEVKITKTSDTKYLFDFHDKKGEVCQTEFSFDGVYTNYKDWSDRFLVYFAFMVAINREAYIFNRAILNSEDAEEFNVDSTNYLGNLRKKASKFLLRMALQEVNEINNATGKNSAGVSQDGSNTQTWYFIDNIVKGFKTRRKETLAITLGLFGSGNFFVNFLSTSDWNIEQFSSVISEDDIFIHRLLIKFRNTDDRLNITISTTNENTYKLIEQDINRLKEEKLFTPYFAYVDRFYKEPEIIKLGEYNILKNDDEIIYLTGSFIISPVEDFSLFEKSKLTVAGAERILNIKHCDLQAKINHALMTK